MTLIAARTPILVCLLHTHPSQPVDGTLLASFVSVVDGVVFEGVVKVVVDGAVEGGVVEGVVEGGVVDGAVEGGVVEGVVAGVFSRVVPATKVRNVNVGYIH